MLNMSLAVALIQLLGGKSCAPRHPMMAGGSIPVPAGKLRGMNVPEFHLGSLLVKRTFIGGDFTVKYLPGTCFSCCRCM